MTLCFDSGEGGWQLETHRPRGTSPEKPAVQLDVPLPLRFGLGVEGSEIFFLNYNLYSKPSGISYCHRQNYGIQADNHR